MLEIPSRILGKGVILVNSSDGIKKCDVGYVKSWGKGSTFREKMHIGHCQTRLVGTSAQAPPCMVQIFSVLLFIITTYGKILPFCFHFCLLII